MTAQSSEILILDGETCDMAFCPPLPQNDPRVIDASDTKEALGMQSTACWRRYRATLEIKDGKFYLIGVCGRFAMTTDEPIFADWVTGTLRVPRGEMLQYVHQGYQSVFEQDQLIKVEDGIVVESVTINNERKPNDEFVPRPIRRRRPVRRP